MSFLMCVRGLELLSQLPITRALELQLMTAALWGRWPLNKRDHAGTKRLRSLHRQLIGLLSATEARAHIKKIKQATEVHLLLPSPSAACGRFLTIKDRNKRLSVAILRVEELPAASQVVLGLARYQAGAAWDRRQAGDERPVLNWSR